MTKRGLRKGVTSYADPDFSLFLRRVFIKAAGYSDDALERPIVGIVNTASDFNPCHGNAPLLIDAVKRGVMLSGALPMVFPTISIHESFANPTSMFLRNLMAMDTEEMIRAQPMDSVVLIGGCDKTLPAQLMGAISADLPAIMLPVGPMLVGYHRGETLGACTDCRRLWSRYRAGTVNIAEIEAVSDRLAPSVGTCMVMGTASTMALIAEAVGLALPLSASAPAPLAERLRIAEDTGKTAAAMARTGSPRPSEILTRASFCNAMVIIQAIGGSTNGIIHLCAMAGRAGIDIDLDELDRFGRNVPVLVDLKPSGDHYMQNFHEAGGLPRLMAELRGILDLSVHTISGKPLSDTITQPDDMHRQKVIRPRSAPLHQGGALAVLRGNLCPRGSLIKQSAASAQLMVHSGRALVFDSVEHLTHGIDAEDLDVTANDVIVLRNAGPRGALGMPEAGYIPIPKKLAAKGIVDMVRISDARMSGTAFGTIVVHITPEASDGGALALVRTGDMISLDVPGRRLDLLVDEKELTKRREDLSSGNNAAAPPRGYARLFHETVLQADKGCDFGFLTASGDGRLHTEHQ